jgi:predicted nucleic acid-binding protein
MITYLDTSTLVKLYVQESKSEEVKNLVARSNAVATSLIAYAEARAAFARRYREKAFTKAQFKKLKDYLEKDWSHLLVIMVSKEIALSAGNLAEKHELRGFDAIHLASAITIKQELQSPIVFSCADQKLQKASMREGFNQAAT